MSDLARALEAIQQGEARAADELLPLVYQELRHLAAHKMAHEGAGHTLQPTALVHEAWLRLTGNGGRHWDSQSHFFAAAAEAMRRILVESARRKGRLKRGGGLVQVNLEDVELPLPMRAEELLALDDALERLAVFDPRAAELVKLCYFLGLTREQAARQLGVAISTVERLWVFARAWLFQEIQATGNGGPEAPAKMG